MSFFQNQDARKLAQNHIEEVADLEEKEAKNLIKTYKSVRQDLADRLDSLPEDSFSAQRIRSVLVQIDSAIIAMKNGLLDDFKSSSEKVALLGPEHLIREINKYNRLFVGAVTPIDIDSILVAQESTNYLFNQYDASLDAYSQGMRSELYRGISMATVEGASPHEIVRRMKRYFIGEEWKLMRLARTELHHIYGMSKQRSLEEAATTIPGLQKTLIHPMDSRTGQDSKQAKAQNLIVDVDKPFKYTFTRRLQSGQVKSEERIFMTPPDRPNDRSIMVPYRREWDS